MPWNVDNYICETIFPTRIGVRPEITMITCISGRKSRDFPRQVFSSSKHLTN